MNLKLDDTLHWRNEIVIDPNKKFTLRNNIGLLKNRIKYNFSKILPLSNRNIENINSLIFPYLK